MHREHAKIKQYLYIKIKINTIKIDSYYILQENGGSGCARRAHIKYFTIIFNDLAEVRANAAHNNNNILYTIN